MTYNGVGMTTIKGSGLSGYVQRSRVTVRQGMLAPRKQRSAMEDEARSTPLEASRSLQENAAIASELAEHDRRRALMLRLLEHKEKRLTVDGVDPHRVEEECRLMGASLVAQYRAELAATVAQRDGVAKARSAKAFADAFDVRSGTASGDAFNRHAKEEDKAKREVDRRAAAEQKLLDRVKRVRHA